MTMDKQLTAIMQINSILYTGTQTMKDTKVIFLIAITLLPNHKEQRNQ
jgi:hypothetical protein